MALSKSDLDNWFTYHAPTSDQLVAYEKIRGDARSFANTINELVPDSADKTAALRKLRECVMTANAAIACYQAPNPSLAESLKLK